jgi:hypothetical protein
MALIIFGRGSPGTIDPLEPDQPKGGTVPAI